MSHYAPVFKALVDLADERSKHLRARCWRLLEALLRDLPHTMPAVPDTSFDPTIVNSHEAMRAAFKEQRNDGEIMSLHEQWHRHWGDEEIPEVKRFMLYAVILLAESYRSSCLRKKAM
jgi:hypothetical protein